MCVCVFVDVWPLGARSRNLSLCCGALNEMSPHTHSLLCRPPSCSLSMTLTSIITCINTGCQHQKLLTEAVSGGGMGSDPLLGLLPTIFWFIRNWTCRHGQHWFLLLIDVYIVNLYISLVAHGFSMHCCAAKGYWCSRILGRNSVSCFSSFQSVIYGRQHALTCTGGGRSSCLASHCRCHQRRCLDRCVLLGCFTALRSFVCWFSDRWKIGPESNLWKIRDEKLIGCGVPSNEQDSQTVWKGGNRKSIPFSPSVRLSIHLPINSFIHHLCIHPSIIFPFTHPPIHLCIHKNGKIPRSLGAVFCPLSYKTRAPGSCFTTVTSYKIS